MKKILLGMTLISSMALGAEKTNLYLKTDSTGRLYFAVIYKGTDFKSGTFNLASLSNITLSGLPWSW